MNRSFLHRLLNSVTFALTHLPFCMSIGVLVTPACIQKSGNTNIGALNRCGDLRLGGAELCDDGNTTDGDGCSKDCKVIEKGFECPADGGECTRNTCCLARDEGDTGCSVPSVEECVCEWDDLCCDAQWDEFCAKIAMDECGAQCSKKLSDCDTPSPFAGCSETAIKDCVCQAENEYCCNELWDAQCVLLADDCKN